MAAPDDETVPLATWCGFGLMCLGMFMAILDIQVVATSLPAIHEALAIELDQMSWIQTAYLIAEVIAIPLSGWLTRALSLRRLFAIAIAVFTLASIGCAASTGFATLVSFRALQGFAGGIIIPLVFTAGVRLFPGRNEALAPAIAGFLAVLAPTVGPWVGGWITQTYSWHWLFLLNVVPGNCRHRGSVVVAGGPCRCLQRAPGRYRCASADRRRADVSRDRFEGSAAIRLAVLPLRCAVCRRRCGRFGLHLADISQHEPDRRSQGVSPAAFRDGSAS